LTELPELARPLIKELPGNAPLKRDPDDAHTHEPRWHQFGIVTHTRRFLECYQDKARGYFEEWGVAEALAAHFQTPIDGVPKGELLEVGICLHDLGKFARGFSGKGGARRPDYTGHEAIAQRLILEDARIRGLLEEYGLTPAQIRYVARCAGVHYELGKIRDAARNSPAGYTVEFATGPEFRRVCHEIATEHPDFKVEIGVLFLCDNLSKTDVHISAGSDAEIRAQAAGVERALRARGLPLTLKAAVLQQPVVVVTVKNYLRCVLAEEAPT
jgi:hypothetical protein